MVLALLYRNQSSLLKGLNRKDESEVADQKVQRLEGSVPSFGSWLNYRKPPIAIYPGGPKKLPECDSEDEDSKEPFFWPWRNVARNQDDIHELLIDILWEWSLDDVATGHLSIKDFKSMMNVPDNQIPDECGTDGTTHSEGLRSMKTIDVATVVFFTPSDSAGSQEERYNRICKWLSEHPKGERNRRIFCLFILREARQWHLSNTRMWDLRIRELQKLLALEPRLPRPIRETFPHYKGTWLGGIALAYLAPLDSEGVSDFTGAQVLERMETAER
jgi:hypothetical protein